MKPGANNLFWALVGTAVLGVVMFLILYFQFQSGRSTLSEQLARKARRVELAGQIRLALASAAEAEKSAVLAVTDAESIAFAAEARAATATAEQTRTTLAALLRTDGTAKENELLAQLSKVFLDFQRVDDELLELAVKNTNIKASALAFGPAADAIKEMDGALARLLGPGGKPASSKEVMLAAAGAQGAALRIQALLAPHIAEESDKKMDELESVMAREDQAVHRALKALTALVPAGNVDLQTATAGYARFTELKTQILKLSRENTNVRSLSISLNQKRKVTALCQDTVAALEKAIEEEHVAGLDNVPVSPR